MEHGDSDGRVMLSESLVRSAKLLIIAKRADGESRLAQTQQELESRKIELEEISKTVYRLLPTVIEPREFLERTFPYVGVHQRRKPAENAGTDQDDQGDRSSP